MRCSSEATRDTRAQLREIVWVFFIDPMALFSKNKQRQHCPMPNKWSAPAFPKKRDWYVTGASMLKRDWCQRYDATHGEGCTACQLYVSQSAANFSEKCFRRPTSSDPPNYYSGFGVSLGLEKSGGFKCGPSVVWFVASCQNASSASPKTNPWLVPPGVHAVPSRRHDCIPCAHVVGERTTRAMLPGTCEDGRSTL